MQIPLRSICLTALLGISACTSPNLDNRPPATAFLSNTGVDLNTTIDRLPFDHAWRDPSADFTQYTHIVVRPVTTRYLQKDDWQLSRSPLVPDLPAYDTQVARVAKHWNASLKKQFSSPVCSYYLTDSTARPHTLILEVALTRAGFARPADRSAGTPAKRPMLAFEARLTDASDGRVLASASDQRESPFEAADFTAGALTLANRLMCDQWSIELMQATNRELFPKVRKQ